MMHSARTPSRSEPRDTPSVTARSFSMGSREPGPRMPAVIICLIPCSTTSVCERPATRGESGSFSIAGEVIAQS